MFRSKAKPYVLGLKEKMSRGRSGVPKDLLRLLTFLSLVNNLQKEHTQTHDATEVLVVPSVRAAS